tara:strand:- start:413 stop:667 length:255 start_codon:yes stop_codon:yes gene_type:complete
MEDTFYLLANPTHRQKKEVQYDSNDRSLLILLNKKFPHINISEDDYNKNISKIEKIFVETYQHKIVNKIVEEIIIKALNEQVLL